MEEARLSFNVKFQVSGLDAQFTCRAGDGEALGSFRNTIIAAVQMVQSLGVPRSAAPAVPVARVPIAPAAVPLEKKAPESIRPEGTLCQTCHQSDSLRLIEFIPKGSTRSMFKYKCERCNKWLSYTPSDEEIAAYREKSAELIRELWPA